MATLVGRTVVCKRVVQGCPVSILGRTFFANLVVFLMQEFDVILEMDWLAKYYVSIDCA